MYLSTDGSTVLHKIIRSGWSESLGHYTTLHYTTLQHYLMLFGWSQWRNRAKLNLPAESFIILLGTIDVRVREQKWTSSFLWWEETSMCQTSYSVHLYSSLCEFQCWWLRRMGGIWGSQQIAEKEKRCESKNGRWTDCFPQQKSSICKTSHSQTAVSSSMFNSLLTEFNNLNSDPSVHIYFSAPFLARWTQDIVQIYLHNIVSSSSQQWSKKILEKCICWHFTS